MEETNTTQENRGAANIADLMAKFMRPANSSEQVMLDTVARYSLQVDPEQHFVLNLLYVTSLDSRVPKEQRDLIQSFIPNYMETKRYHDTMPYIAQAIGAISLKQFWSHESMKGQIVKQNQ